MTEERKRVCCNCGNCLRTKLTELQNLVLTILAMDWKNR